MDASKASATFPLLILPRELVLHVLSFVDQPRDVAALLLSGPEVYDIVVSTERLKYLLHLPKFDAQHSVDVKLSDGGRRAVCAVNLPPGCPTWRRTTAFVAAPKETNLEPQFYHFRLTGQPSSKFCFAISSRRPETNASQVDVPQWDLSRESFFMAYYFRSGSLHSYGSPALYRREAIEEARYEQGDIISIQIGLKSAQESQDLTPEWKSPLQLFDRGQSRKGAEAPVRLVSYAILYKNYEMVHDPLEFVGVQQWPLFVGVSFTTATAGEAVEIVCPPEGAFRPVLPNPSPSTP